MLPKLKRLILITTLSLTALCLIAVILTALSNRTLPTRSQILDRLSEVEKARLAEAIQLRQQLGNQVWPGWSDASIPIIVHNEAYAFLVNYPFQPPSGWLKMPQHTHWGVEWEPVPSDTFLDQVYYRQTLQADGHTPENFTVLVGETWTATLFTREYSEISFYADFGEQQPSFIQAFFPYRLFWNLIMGSTETYIGALLHETFHAFQGSYAESLLAEAEFANQSEPSYPWDDPTVEENWREELALLHQAVRAETQEETANLARFYLNARVRRRTAANLDPQLIEYERQREWLEGLAKYAELEILRIAGSTPEYAPLPGLTSDPDFKHYAATQRYWDSQVAEIQRLSGREGETRFYYSGMAQAVLLDRLSPTWKQQAFQPGIALEDLLEIALNP